jgi:hypothetical protein
MHMLTITELEALGGVPEDTIRQAIDNGLFDTGWLLQREPPLFHEKTAILLARTLPLLERVRAGDMTMQKFHQILWSLAYAGPERLVEYLSGY